MTFFREILQRRLSTARTTELTRPKKDKKIRKRFSSAHVGGGRTGSCLLYSRQLSLRREIGRLQVDLFQRTTAAETFHYENNRVKTSENKTKKPCKRFSSVHEGGGRTPWFCHSRQLSPRREIDRSRCDPLDKRQGAETFHCENNRVNTSEKRQKAVQTILKRAWRRGSYSMVLSFTSAFTSTRNRQASS